MGIQRLDDNGNSILRLTRVRLFILKNDAGRGDDDDDDDKRRSASTVVVRDDLLPPLYYRKRKNVCDRHGGIGSICRVTADLLSALLAFEKSRVASDIP